MWQPNQTSNPIQSNPMPPRWKFRERKRKTWFSENNNNDEVIVASMEENEKVPISEITPKMKVKMY